MGSHVQTGLAACFSRRRIRPRRHQEAREDAAGQGRRPHAAHGRARARRPGPVFLTYRASPDDRRDRGARRRGRRRSSTSRAPTACSTRSGGCRPPSRRRSSTRSGGSRALHRRRPSSRGSAARARAALAETAATAHESDTLPRGRVSRTTRCRSCLQPPREGPRRQTSRRAPRGAGEDASRAAGPGRPARKGEVSMFLAGHWHTLTLPQPQQAKTPGDTLDVSQLQDAGARAVLGIGDVRTDKRIDFVGGARGTGALERAVGSGAAAVAFSLYPGERRRPDGDLRRRRHHAAEVHVVRAEAPRRPADSRDLTEHRTDGRSRRRPVRAVGIDGLKAAGCEVVYDPSLRRRRWSRRCATRAPTCSSSARRRSPRAMLDAGPLALIVRAGAGYNTIDVAAASARGIYVSNCPGKNAIAVAELAFALLLALDRRIPDNVADLRAGHWNKKEYSKARGLQGPDARPARLRQHRPGDGAPRARVRHAPGRLEPALRSAEPRTSRRCGSTTGRTIFASRSSRRRRRSPRVRRPERAPGARAGDAEDSSTRRSSTRLKPGAYFINTARAESSTTPRSSRRSANAGFASALDVFADEPSAGDRRLHRSDRRAAERLRHAPHRRLHRPGAGSDRRRNRPHRRGPTRRPARCRTSSTSRRRRRRRTCSSSGTAIGPACSRTCSTSCAPATINVQETENVIFEGAEAAVARINLDGAPTDAVLALIASGGNRDILALQLVAIQ